MGWLPLGNIVLTLFNLGGQMLMNYGFASLYAMVGSIFLPSPPESGTRATEYFQKT